MSKRYHSRFVTVDVDVDLSEFDTEALIEELAVRGKGEEKLPYQDEMMELRGYLQRGQCSEALALLEMLLFPKWQSEQQCLTAFKARAEHERQKRSGNTMTTNDYSTLGITGKKPSDF